MSGPAMPILRLRRRILPVLDQFTLFDRIWQACTLLSKLWIIERRNLGRPYLYPAAIFTKDSWIMSQVVVKIRQLKVSRTSTFVIATAANWTLIASPVTNLSNSSAVEDIELLWSWGSYCRTGERRKPSWKCRSLVSLCVGNLGRHLEDIIEEIHLVAPTFPPSVKVLNLSPLPGWASVI